jgi:pimeloyl-ACP methyl ester carboxylesterase
VKSAPRLTVPTLYVVGQLDSDFVPDAQRLHDATASHGKSLQALPVGHHGVDLVRFDARARALVEAFLRSR